MKLTASLICALPLLISCAGAVRPVDTKYADYLPDDKQPVVFLSRTDLQPDQKAVVEFSTNTSDNTYFQFTTPKNMCGLLGVVDTVSVRRAFEFTEEAKRIRAIGSFGILSLIDSKAPSVPQRVVKEFPSGEDLWIRAGIFQMATNVKVECGPLYIKLRPEAGKRYRLGMESQLGQCRVNLSELGSSGSTAVPPHSTWKCTPSLTGLDGNKVTAFEDHPGR